MFSGKDKAHIRLEEKYRFNLRKQMEKQVQPPKSILRIIVNLFSTALGLWFLSTVAVGLITFGYTWFKESSQESLRRQTEARKIDLEIIYRLRIIKGAIESLKSGQTKENIMYPTSIDEKGSVNYIEPVSSASPMYANTSMLSLLSQLQDNIDDEDSKKEIGRALASWMWILDIRQSGVHKLELLTDSAELGGLGLNGVKADREWQRIKKQDGERMLGELKRNFYLSRWKLPDGIHILDLPQLTQERPVPSPQPNNSFNPTPR
jgi:hypothetical protein